MYILARFGASDVAALEQVATALVYKGITPGPR
jgi:hypothetical protein